MLLSLFVRNKLLTILCTRAGVGGGGGGRAGQITFKVCCVFFCCRFIFVLFLLVIG